ncbi:hypothetical protein GJ744_005137 [Endocarpon pusillum]|uniref:Uncharacterized protein n=1 Tax=Endocarpon pusillum TaxID=364733 RepID=A0A8H7E7H5_9EURO|nr:hypothetical protein GJ744_005137 [Endocarpon pusillum]
MILPTTIIKAGIISTGPFPCRHHHADLIPIILLLHPTHWTRIDSSRKPGHAAQRCSSLDEAETVVESSFVTTGGYDGYPAMVAHMGFPALSLAHGWNERLL